MIACVFSGPSLPPPGPAGNIRWLPPARQGDLYRAALEGPVAIGLVDGYFETTATVWHKEILWAMAEGIHVFGSASLGALRAAELDSFGMRGIGEVYAAFRDGRLEDDDEVAVLHGPAEVGYIPVTEAMVNVRATLARAAAVGVLSEVAAEAVCAAAKALHFKDRTWPEILASALSAGLGPDFAAAFGRWLPQGRVDQKRRDATLMVAAMRRHLIRAPGKLRVSYAFPATGAWEMACHRVRRQNLESRRSMR